LYIVYAARPTPVALKASLSTSQAEYGVYFMCPHHVLLLTQTMIGHFQNLNDRSIRAISLPPALSIQIMGTDVKRYVNG